VLEYLLLIIYLQPLVQERVREDLFHRFADTAEVELISERKVTQGQQNYFVWQFHHIGNQAFAFPIQIQQSVFKKDTLAVSEEFLQRLDRRHLSLKH